MFDKLASTLAEAGIAPPDEVRDLEPDRLTEIIAETRCLESMLVARRLAAVDALLWHRMLPEELEPDKQYDFVDGLLKTSAEVSALLDISSMAAQFVVHYAQALADRLPQVAALLAAGRTTWATVQVIVDRTDLVVKSELMGRLDQMLAARLEGWGSWSRRRIVSTVDALVFSLDPDAAKERRLRDAADRRIGIKPLPNGMADMRGIVAAADARAFDRRLSDLAKAVCASDPRTMEQRRADALGALATGQELACRCGKPDCPTRTHRPADAGIGARVVINVVAAADTLSGASERPGYLAGYGVIDAEQVRDLAAQASQLLLDTDLAGGDPYRYHPSAALDRAIRCRDLTCRFPGCDQPAEQCDIDHTVAFNHAEPAAGGLTVPDNLKCLCRQHHRLKTFVDEWRDRQLPDGTVIWKSPTGKTFATKPIGAELFPELARRRRRTRAQERSRRIAAARNRNHLLRPANDELRWIRESRKREIEARKFRNHMRDMLFLFKGKASTSPFCRWVNDPREPEELSPDWAPPAVGPPSDEPPF